jgi:hypothetical protein
VLLRCKVKRDRLERQLEPAPNANHGISMAHAAGDSTRAPARLRVEIQEYPQNLAAGGAISPLALERFDLVAARLELDHAHRACQDHASRSTLQRLLNAVRRHRELTGGH